MKPVIRTPYFEVGTKNYVYGDKLLEYARAADAAAEKYDIDVLFIGPMDISQSLGHPGDPAHPEVQQVVRQVIDTCNANEKPFGIFVGTTEAARKYRDLGVSYIAIASDLAFMAKGYHQMVDELKK